MFKCKKCSKEFSRKSSLTNHEKYCNGILINKCLECGIETKNPKFCCLSCASNYNNRNKTMTEEAKSIMTNKCKKWWTSERKTQQAETRKNNPIKLPETFSESCRKGQNNYWKERDKEIMESKPFDEWPVRLIKKQLLLKNGNVCEKCSYSYTDKDGKGPFQFHHKDGNNKNWKKENIEILCLNCHWMTPNFAFKGRKHTEKTKRIIAEKSKAYQRRKRDLSAGRFG